MRLDLDWWMVTSENLGGSGGRDFVVELLRSCLFFNTAVQSAEVHRLEGGLSAGEFEW